MVRAALAPPQPGCSYVLACNSRIQQQLGTTPAEVLQPHFKCMPFRFQLRFIQGWPGLPEQRGAPATAGGAPAGARGQCAGPHKR